MHVAEVPGVVLLADSGGSGLRRRLSFEPDDESLGRLPCRGDGGALRFDEVLETYLLPLGIPVAYGFPFGHVDDQWTLPLGVRARFDAGQGTVDLMEAAVS